MPSERSRVAVGTADVDEAASTRAKAVEELRAALIAQGGEEALEEAMSAAAPNETETELLCRFLQARNFKVEKALQMLVADSAWRREKNIASFRTCPATDVLGCNPTLLNEVLPHGCIGRDFQGRPVMYKDYGSFVVNKFKESTCERLVMYDTWMTERSLGMLKQGQQQFVVIIDLKGVGWANMSKAQLKYCRALADAGAPHYPERLGKTLIINAPSIFCWAFRIITSWLDERTRDKIELLGGASAYEPVLDKILDRKILPVGLGGETVLEGHQSFELYRSDGADASPATVRNGEDDTNETALNGGGGVSSASDHGSAAKVDGEGGPDDSMDAE